MAVQVKSLEVIHKGNCHDGFPTTIKIDGNDPPGLPARYEKSVTVQAKAMKELAIRVEFSDGTEETYLPENFNLQLGELSIIRPFDGFNPCQILVESVELYVTEANIRFAEGEAVLVHLVFMPTIK